MAFCNFTSIIYDTECIGDSLFTINSNFANLDSNICELGGKFLDLEAFVKSLSAKDSPTIDKSFSVLGYFLSSDVKNNSLGTTKLGIDIPFTTKVFLTGAKISSLTDVNINAPALNQVLSWNGTKWINKTFTDDVGAKVLEELDDVEFSGSLQDGQVLKYNALTRKWYNGPDAGLLRVPDGDYGDITVSNNGLNWNIDQGVVTRPKIANNAVNNDKIAPSAITNDKIVDRTIELGKCAFEVGEINTGVNVGTGTGMYIGNDQSKRLQFRSLRGSGIVSVTEDGNEIVIRGANPDAPPDPTGENVGNGAGIFKNSNGNTLYFKRIRAGAGISITDNGDDISINATPVTLGLSIIGINNLGQPLDDNAIIGRLSLIYPPGNFASGTLCRVEVQVPSAAGVSGDVTVDVPFEIKYYKKGAASFKLIEPDAVETEDDTFTQSRTLQVNVDTGVSNPSLRITREIKTYQIASEGFWFLRP